MKVRGRIIGDDCVSEIVIDAGKIQQILPASTSSNPTDRSDWIGGDNCWIAPGFIDIQVNGWGGRNINWPQVTPSDVKEVTHLLYEHGVTMFLPTVTTQSRENICKSLSAVRQAMGEFEEVAAACPMIHLEGPYISPEEGPRGAHPLEHVRPPDLDEFRIFQEAAGGKIGMVTLAPEVEGAIPFIEKLSEARIIPAIGHASPAASDIQASIKAGARISTHLGNGAHAKIDRHPNYIWEQLASDDLHASLIADGHHLPASVVKCMVRGKGVERCILITDAIGLAGKPPGLYRDWDVAEVELKEDGAARLKGTPYLAGAVMPLTRCIENTVRFAGVSLEQAIDMATINPAVLLGLDDCTGNVEAGKDANLVLFSWDSVERKMQVVTTIVQGEVVWQR